MKLNVRYELDADYCEVQLVLTEGSIEDNNEIRIIYRPGLPYGIVVARLAEWNREVMRSFALLTVIAGRMASECYRPPAGSYELKHFLMIYRSDVWKKAQQNGNLLPLWDASTSGATSGLTDASVSTAADCSTKSIVTSTTPSSYPLLEQP